MPRRTSQAHPLLPYADGLDPKQVYTVRALASLMGMTPTSLSGLVTHGFLPGARLRPLPRGGSERVWTGAQLQRIARRPVRIAYDHERYSPATLYRVGCRCPVCTAAHTAESRERKRGLSEDAFGADDRARVLELVTEGHSVVSAAKKVGTSSAQVYGRALWDAAFGQALDEAAWKNCVLGPQDPMCSTPAGYRGNPGGDSPRPECRGTGCREWRREQSRQERAEQEPARGRADA